MAFVEWSDERYAIGVERVYEQHQQLFELLNDLHDAMQEGQRSDLVGETLEKLEDYTYHHFDSEEDFMNECGFSQDCDGCFLAHQDAHREFEEQVSELREMYEDGEATVAMKTLRFLRSWLSEHVGTSTSNSAPISKTGRTASNPRKCRPPCRLATPQQTGLGLTPISSSVSKYSS